MGMLRLSATKTFARLCATQNRYVATLRDPKKVCCDHCDSKWVCCNFAGPKYLRTFGRLKNILQFCAIQKQYVPKFRLQVRVDVCNICFNLVDGKMVCFDRLDPGSICLNRLHSNCLCFDNVRPRMNISTKFDQGLNGLSGFPARFEQSEYPLVLFYNISFRPTDPVERANCFLLPHIVD